MSTTETFSTALADALEAINEALDALETIERLDTEYVMPLIRAQSEVKDAMTRYHVLTRAS